MSNNFNSDIFNAYAKIAEDQGLVSSAELESDKSKKILEKNPRTDSLTQEKISKLYNVVTDAPKGMGYKRNIGEVAHKNPVVIAPSYDKLNALVESDNERQDILMRIVDKRTNGLLTQHKYAKQELIRTLVKIANHMDNIGQDEIRSLADSCLQEQNLKKKADWDDFQKSVGDVFETIYATVRADLPFALTGGLIAMALPMFGVGAGIAGAGGILSAFTAGFTRAGIAGLIFGPIVHILFSARPTITNISENSKIALERLNVLLENKNIKSMDKINNQLEELKKNLIYLSEHSKQCLDIMGGKDVSFNEASSTGSEFISVKNNTAKQIDDYNKNYTAIKGVFETGSAEATKQIKEWYSVLIGGLDPAANLKKSLDSLKQSIDGFDKIVEAKKPEAKDEIKENLDLAEKWLQAKQKDLFGSDETETGEK